MCRREDGLEFEEAYAGVAFKEVEDYGRPTAVALPLVQEEPTSDYPDNAEMLDSEPGAVAAFSASLKAALRSGSRLASSIASSVQGHVTGSLKLEGEAPNPIV